MYESRIKEVSEKFKDFDPTKRTVTGYLSRFGNIDSDGDVMVQGCYAKSIAEIGPNSAKPRIKYLLDHDRTKAIGRFTVLKEDDYGLYYEAYVGTHSTGEDFLKMCNDGLITEHSVNFYLIQGKMQDESYHITEAMLREGSALQFWGANADTPLTGIKSAEDAIATLARFENALRKGTYTDETFLKLAEQVDSIKAFLTDKVGTPPENEKSTEPDETEVYYKLANSLLKSFS